MTLLRLLAIAACFCVAARPAAADPRLAITTKAWRSAHGTCTKSIPHVTVTGVSGEMRDRIDGVLERMLAGLVPDANATPAAWESACAKDVAANASYRKFVGRSFVEFESADWTQGLARGRWLSARLHQTSFAGGAHPEDAYMAVTFDLAHGGYPVPTNGFYTRDGRARFNRAVVHAQIASLRAMGADMATPDAVASLESAGAGLRVGAAQILVTAAGIEITGLGNDEASRNWIVQVPFAALATAGTPGGPLDAATR